MKKKTISLFGLCALSMFHMVCGAFQDVEIHHVDANRIAQHELSLAQDLCRNSWMRFGLKTTAGVAALTACAAMIKGFSIVSGTDLKLINERTEQHQAQIAALVAACNNPGVVIDLEEFKQLKALSQGGWGSMLGGIALNLVCGAAFNHSMQLVLSKVFFDKTIEWFLQAKTTKLNLDHDIQHFKEEIILPVKDGKIILTAYASEKFSRDLVRLYNLCVDNTERIVAYMQHTLKSYDAAKISIYGDPHVGTFLLQSLNDLSAEVDTFENRFGRTASEKQKMDALVEMFTHIETYMGHLNAIIQMFATMEQKIELAS